MKGFEPLKPLRAHAFQACAIDHYATSPCIPQPRQAWELRYCIKKMAFDKLGKLIGEKLL